MDEAKLLKALGEIRGAEKKRKFDQSVDLIVNLRNFDVRKEAFSLFIGVPHKIKDKKIVGIFEKRNDLIDTILKDDFGKYKEKKDVRNLIKSYDFFIANAKLMPLIATKLGRVLGPAGKMPSPQLGVLFNEDENTITTLISKINKTVKIRVKEPSIKVSVARESLSDEQIVENVLVVYNKLLETLPKKIDNIKNVLIKFSMGKPSVIDRYGKQ